MQMRIVTLGEFMNMKYDDRVKALKVILGQKDQLLELGYSGDWIDDYVRIHHDLSLTEKGM